MKYTGEDCRASDNNQDSQKTACIGDPDFKSEVFILAGDKENPDDSKARVWFEGWVDLNDAFDINAANAGESYLGSTTWVHIYEHQDGDDDDDNDDGEDRRYKHGDKDRHHLQKVGFHTSCSQPLAVGDQFGSLVLKDIDLVSK